MPSLGLLLIAAAGAALLLSSSKSEDPAGPPKPTPDPPKPKPDVIPGTPKVVLTTLTMTSRPTTGPAHEATLRSDGTWWIQTTGNTLVIDSLASSKGEASMLSAWNTYTNGGVDGVVLRDDGVFGGFHVRPRGFNASFPNAWPYGTDPTWGQGFTINDALKRHLALQRAIRRARTGT